MFINNNLNKGISMPIAILIVMVAAVIGGGLVLWQYDGWMFEKEEIEKPKDQTEEKTAKLTIDKIKNAEYGTCWSSKIDMVKFTDGFYDEPPLNPEWTTGGWSIRIVEDKIAFGDLNNDGENDTALILNSFGGGSGSFYEIVALLNDNGEPLYLDCEQLGDRVKINSIDIQSGNIILDIITHGPNDGLCCPTLKKIIKYKLSGNKLIEIITDKTANWKTYRNEEYGYEVSYPPQWYLYASDSSDIYLQPGKEIQDIIPGPHSSALGIEVNVISPDIILLQIVKNELPDGIEFSQAKINIGGLTGMKVITLCEGIGCGAPEWFVIKNNYLYHFDSNLGYTSIFEQIISTFQFIE